MAVIDTTHTHASTLAIIGLTFTRLVGMFTTWNDARITHNALIRLSEHELNDIGISRGDISRIVRGY